MIYISKMDTFRKKNNKNDSFQIIVDLCNIDCRVKVLRYYLKTQGFDLVRYQNEMDTFTEQKLVIINSNL